MDEPRILSRIDELLKRSQQAPGDDARMASELFQSAVSLLALVHGLNSHQLRSFNDHVADIRKSGDSRYIINMSMIDSSLGALQSLKYEIEQGLVGNLRREITGEVLGDLLQLAKATLDEGVGASKNVAAVLVAAAFEDTIRRLGALYCGIETRESLPEILSRLKTAEILKGSQVGVVQSHFQFRNDAMHADWDKIDVVSVRTVAALVQELLLKHFA